MARARFQAGVGGTLRFTPPDALLFGRPSSATVSIRSSLGTDLPTPVAGAAAVLDPVDTRIMTAALTGTRQVEVLDATGIVPGMELLLSHQDGERMLVEVAGVNPATRVVLLAEELIRDVGELDQLQGVGISYVLSGAQCPMPVIAVSGLASQDPTLVDPGPTTPQLYGRTYRAAWTYVIGGATFAADTLYTVHRRIITPTLTPDEVARQMPGDWYDLVPGGPRAVIRVMADAWSDLLDEIASKGYDPDRIMDAERFRKPHRSRVLAMVSKTWPPAAWKEWADARSLEAQQDLDHALASGDWYDKLEDAIQTPQETRWPVISLSR